MTKKLRFYLLGECESENPTAITRAQIAIWEKQGIVKYLGQTRDVRPFIESASCIVLPSFYKEGVPRVLLEAMALHKPIICTAIPGCTSCIEPPLTPYNSLLIGKNGILIPPKDAKALSLAMSLLTPDLIRTMGENGRAYVKRRFCIHRIIDSYHHALKCLRLESKLPLRECTFIDSQHSKNIEYKPLSSADSVRGDSKDKNTRTKDAENTQKNRADAKHIAFVSNTSSAMYNFRLKVLQALKAQGFSIHIIAPFDWASAKLQAQGFHTYHLPINSRSLNPIKDLRTIFCIHRFLRHIKPLFVFNYTIKPVIYGSFLCHYHRIPHIAIITGLGYVFIKGGRAKAALRYVVCKMYAIALKGAKAVWFLNNEDMREFIESQLIAQSQAFMLDSEGVDCEYFAPRTRTENQQNGDEEIAFLLIGRMLWDKGVGEFIQAARMLKGQNIDALDSKASNAHIKIAFNTNGGGVKTKDNAKHSTISKTSKATESIAISTSSNVRFYLLGECESENPTAITRAQIAIWEKQGIVKYLGQTRDVRPFIESASCIVLPSYREGVSVSLLEAMAMAKPIITSNAIGCKHLVRESYNGFCCEVGDHVSLALAMRKFIGLSCEERKQMGANARKYVYENYDISRIVHCYEKALNVRT